MDHAARGTAALSSSDYAAAITSFTAALEAHPTSPDYYIKRSTAYQRASPPDHALALADAELGVVCARQRARYELVTAAQMRRAIALFHLGRYRDAEFVLGVVRRRSEKEKGLDVWERKVREKVEVLAEGEGERKVEEVPDVKVPTGEPKKEEKGKAKEASASAQHGKAEEAKAAPAQVQQTPPSQIRQDWYQNNDSVTVTLLAKGVPKDKLIVEIQERSLSISFPTITASTYDYSLDPLFAPILPAQSSYKVLATKIEVILKKASAGKWRTLEGDAATSTSTTTPSTAQPASSTTTTDPTPPSGATTSAPPPSGPSYPTSSRSGPKNWDKLALDEAGDDDDDEQQDPNFFFKTLYKGADDDTKRAMMKSYVESNGTALSTNWSEVGKGKVETSPPEGMVAKKWGE